MGDICPSTSSPSIYSHPPSQTGHGRQTIRTRSGLGILFESDSEDDSHLSMISGPTVRKYAENPWNEGWPKEDGSGKSGISRQATRMMRSATQMKTRTVSPSGSNSTDSSGSNRRGLVHILGVGGKHILTSGSAVSLASTQTASRASADDRSHPITPKPKAAFSPPSPRSFAEDESTPFAPRKSIGDEMKLGPSALPNFNDRPLLSSGSPGFRLISLEVAQEWERVRALNRSQAKAIPRRQVDSVDIHNPNIGVIRTDTTCATYFYRDLEADTGTFHHFQFKPLPPYTE